MQLSAISWNINKQLENIARVRKKAIKSNEIHNKLRQNAKARMVWSYRKNARNKNGQSNTRLENHFKKANGKTKDTLGGGS